MKSFNYKTGIIFDEYFIIGEEAYHEKIRFYEKYRKEILDLPFEQSCKIRLDHSIALAKVGAHHAFLRKAEPLLSIVIEHNIFNYKGIDIFQELLYNKADALYKLYEHSKALSVLKELIKINPDEEKYKKHFYKISVEHKRSNAQTIRGITILMFLVAAILIALQLMVVNSFYPQYSAYIENVRNALLLFACLLIASNELLIRYKSIKDIITTIQQKNGLL